VNGILFRDEELQRRKAAAGPRSSAAAPAVSWQSRIPRLVRDLIRLLLVGVGALIVLSRVWELNVGGLFTALGISSIVLGLALQEPLGNALSGVLLLIQQPFQVGDWVRASGDVGQVKEITWHSAIIQTQQNEIKVVPNALLAKAVVGNFTGADSYWIKPIALTFPATVPPNKVDEALTRIACDIPGVLAEPAPQILVIGIRGTNLAYTISFCVASYEAMDEARGMFLRRLWYASRRRRTGLPPVGAADPNAPIISDGAVRSRLDAFSLFTRLTPEGRDDVASGAELEIYAAGERLQTEGAMSDGVRFVLSGRVCLHVSGPSGTTLEVECLDRGGIFGETGPGAICSMTAVAATDVEVLSLDYACLNVVLRHDPHLVRDVVRTVEAFQRGAEATRQAADRRSPSATILLSQNGASQAGPADEGSWAPPSMNKAG
jgi:CRP-like cAMP-binding protein